MRIALHGTYISPFGMYLIDLIFTSKRYFPVYVSCAGIFYFTLIDFHFLLGVLVPILVILISSSNLCQHIFSEIHLSVFFCCVEQKTERQSRELLVESQNGINAVERCSVDNHQLGHYCCTKSVAIASFWFSMDHHWKALIPFWLSADEM